MRIKFSRLNMESEAMYDCITNKGFLISEQPFSDIDKTIRNIDGPRSPRYGTTFEDVDAFNERYRCPCGKSIGAAFEGEICPDCGKPIEYLDTDIKYTGYINFSPYKVINPLMYHRLQTALSKKILENIISTDNIITPNGVLRKYDDPLEVKKSKLMYHNIGMKNFYEHYEEIMEYFKTKRKARIDMIDDLIKDKDIIWTSKIPVYSTVLRPHHVSAESFYYCSQDREINPLVAISSNLKTASPIEVPIYLQQAQVRINNLWMINFSLIDGKNGWVRGSCLGGEFNSSGRSVIVLDPSLKIDEVDMPYNAFLEQYKGHIIREICRDKGWTITKATNYLSSKFNYDEYVYSIMCRLVDTGIRLIINRNPEQSRGCKKAQDVVKAVGSVILLRALEAVLPPRVACCLEVFPIVSGKAPVLAGGVGTVRGRAGAQGMVKKVRQRPCVGGIFVHHNRHVAL